MASTLESEFPCSLSIDIPLPTERLASTALQALQVDKELSPLVQRNLHLVASEDGKDASQQQQQQQEAILRAEYRAATNRMLRVAVNSFMESLRLVVEVMEKLDVDVLEEEQQQRIQGEKNIKEPA